MKLQEQTCTAEQSARLVELGVKPQATFWHMKAKDGAHGEYIQYGWSSEAIAPAYNVAEMGEMTRGYETRIELQNNGNYLIIEKGLTDAFFYAQPTEARARAALLIYLLANRNVELPCEWRQDQPEPLKESK